jgi:hypothetical protein
MFREAVRQGAVGWVDDVLRLGRPWPLWLDEIRAEVSFHHGEVDTNVHPQHAKKLAERIPGSRLRLYPGEGVRFGPLHDKANENFNEHFKSIFEVHGQVPTRGEVNTARFVLGAVFVYQLGVLHRHEQGLEVIRELKAFLNAA